MRMRARFLVAGVVVFGLQGCACSKKPDEGKQLGKVVAAEAPDVLERRRVGVKSDFGNKESQQASSMPTQKSVASGTMYDGKTSYVYSAKYWSMQNKSENCVPVVGSGPQLWQGLMKRLAKAKTFDDYAACYTEDSLPRLQKHRAKLKGVLGVEDKDAEPDREQYYVTVNVLSDDVERLFMAFAPEFVEPERAGPPFFVRVLRKVGNEYKVDLTQTKNPVFQALQAGQWKQFGAPRDYSDVQDDAISTQSAP